MIFNKFELLKISGVQRKYVSIILIDDFIIEILHIFQLPDPLSFILFIILNPNYIIKKIYYCTSYYYFDLFKYVTDRNQCL